MANVDRILTTLRRPPEALSALAALSEQDVAVLEAAVDAACARQREAVQTAVARIVPRLLRRIVLGREPPERV